MNLAKLQLSNLSAKTITDALFHLPWWEIGAKTWRITLSIWAKLQAQGMYEALSYTCTLELQDRQGRLVPGVFSLK